RKPCAVSRKYTSSLWMFAHFVRSRPARYPPIDELRTSSTISQMIDAVPIVEADAPTLDHGETDDKPSPAPSARSMRTRAAITNAPAITADQETPEECASLSFRYSTLYSIGAPFLSARLLNIARCSP